MWWPFNVWWEEIVSSHFIKSFDAWLSSHKSTKSLWGNLQDLGSFLGFDQAIDSASKKVSELYNANLSGGLSKKEREEQDKQDKKLAEELDAKTKAKVSENKKTVEVESIMTGNPLLAAEVNKAAATLNNIQPSSVKGAVETVNSNNTGKNVAKLEANAAKNNGVITSVRTL